MRANGATSVKRNWLVLFGPLLLAEELVTEPLQYEDFELVVPTGNGLGVELDDDRLRFFQRGR